MGLGSNIWEGVKDTGLDQGIICYGDTVATSNEPSDCSEAQKTLWTWFKFRKGRAHEVVSRHKPLFRGRPTQETGEYDLRQGSSFQPKPIFQNDREGMSASILKVCRYCSSVCTVSSIGVFLNQETLLPRIIYIRELANFPTTRILPLS